MVEKWLAEVETSMLLSLKHVIKKSLDSYPKLPRTEFVLSWPGQVVICVSSVFWTAEVAESLQNKTVEVNMLFSITLSHHSFCETHKGILGNYMDE